MQEDEIKDSENELRAEIPSENSRSQKKPKIIEIISGSSLFKYTSYAMIIFAICFLANIFTFQIMLTPVDVAGYSMLPSINASAQGESGDIYTDYVFIAKSQNIKRRDIVVIKGGRTQSGNELIKRVIALPGDTLTFKRVRVERDSIDAPECYVVDIYLNGKLLKEDYTKDKYTRIANVAENPYYYNFHNTLVKALENSVDTDTAKAHEFTIKLGKDEYFVMGDNRNKHYGSGASERDSGSTDSRDFGPITKSEILGKVKLQVKNGQNLLQAIWSRIFSNRLISSFVYYKI